MIGVAVSGGMDSLVCVYLLKEKGKSVCGFHALFVEPTEKSTYIKNKLVEHFLEANIPLYILDLREEFKELVIKPFIDAYIKGLTPNPCCICNKKIKFGVIWEKAKELGVEGLATGHYACKKIDPNGIPMLYRGKDLKKEQSYFLSLLDLSQLKIACFPLGEYTKNMVRREIRKRVLAVPSQLESQEVCFIKGDYREFLKENVKNLPPPGPIEDTSGKKLGEHEGLYAYTIGQRRGLKIPYSEPLYVIKKDIKRNVLIVGPKRELKSKKFCVKEMNFLLDFSKWPKEVYVQTNYRQAPKKVFVKNKNSFLEVFFEKEEKPATPGQIAAFYTKDNRVLGGGVIFDEELQ